MKNKIITLVILMALALAACSTATTTASQSGTSSKAKSYAGQAELIVGIFKLEGTAQAVTTKQASELLPLWEMMKVLTNSDTSAQEEVDATISEIKATLTPAQLQAIADMKLTEQNIPAFEQGSNTTVQSSSKSSSGSQSGGGFGGPDGGGPGGDSLSGIVAGVSQTSGTQSTQASGGASNQAPTELISALIKVLQEKAAA
jgi:hypothetical protein